MCRWAAYIGQPIFLEEVVSAPCQSLMHQSLHAREGKTETNGDGFGVAWYGERDRPGVYRDVMPAWADANLDSLAHQVRSGCFLSHVRASTGTATSRTNCHPFQAGRWTFMHNGQFGGFDAFRRQADMMIDQRCYKYRQGTTDSEALFLISLGEGLEYDPRGALQRATGRLQDLSRAHGERPHVRMTVAFSDGATLYAARYATDDHAPSLYTGATCRGQAVVSEPLGGDGEGWNTVEPGQFIAVTPGDVSISDFRPS